MPGRWLAGALVFAAAAVWSQNLPFEPTHNSGQSITGAFEGLMIGLGVGVFVSLLLELLGRRVRTADDLATEDDLPLICIIAGPDSNRRVDGDATRRRGWRSWLPPFRGIARA